jgi:phosphopantothenoylcysteine decarboxylase/phosphopantothenate--cysteine ligase
MSFKNKRVLITAGPTWVKIDSVRIISNTASGKTGIILANRLAKLGAKVTLLLGPRGGDGLKIKKNVRLISFKFFDELRDLLGKELRAKNVDYLIHSAAVSDYRVAKLQRKKIRSGIKNFNLKLTPTPKIIKEVRKLNPDTFLVGFKFEPNASRNSLIKEANCQIDSYGSNLVVANTVRDGSYLAYLVSKNGIYGVLRSKAQTVKALIDYLRSNFR